jgi:hypothetical protein
MRSDNEHKDGETMPLERSEPEPTLAATPVAVRASRSAAAKPRAASKAKRASTPSPNPAPKPAAETPAPPRTRRAPVKAAPKKTEPTAKAARPARSRRAPARVGGEEASIPPTVSDVADGGKTIAATEVGPILPAPMPTLVSVPEEDADVAGDVAGKGAMLPVPARSSRVSPYAKAAVGLLVVVSLVFFGRGFVRHAAVPPSAAPALAAAPVEPAPVEAPAEPTLEAITPPVDTNPESAEGLKRASLDALEHRKLDDAIAAGEKATLLDPTDADAWLILGAAYHDQGNFLAARRSYGACAKQATRGEVRECKFLLQ